ncbi:transposase [Streptomyces sp. NPDC001982]|uniref:transposase n=1 Tax=Streptomyces sp. NPDC001982 TaxID=3154405 RepID=UPI00332D0BE5
MKGIRPATATDHCRRDIARDLLADLRRLDRQVKDNEAQMRDALAAARTSLTSLPGLGTVLAAKLLGHVGDISRFPTEHHLRSAFPLTTPPRQHPQLPRASARTARTCRQSALVRPLAWRIRLPARFRAPGHYGKRRTARRRGTPPTMRARTVTPEPTARPRSARRRLTASSARPRLQIFEGVGYVGS